MNKKIVAFFASFILASVAFGDGVYGVIVDVSDASKSILVETTYGQRINMKILPNTEIDMDNCGIFGTDRYGTFRDLKVGTFIKAEIFYGYGYYNNQGLPSQGNPNDPNAVPTATVKEIEIECGKRAY